MDMFDNYPQTEMPDNRHRKLPCFRIDIMTGETASHSFEVPFDVDDMCVNYEVSYRLGLDTIITKTPYTSKLIINDDGTSVITVDLSTAETELFRGSNLNTHVQIKFFMTDGTVGFSEIYPVKVKESIKPEGFKPAENVVYGTNYGYTED